MDERQAARLEQEIAALRARVDALEGTVDRWRVNSNRVLDGQNLLTTAGGTAGTSTQAARADHTH